MSLTRRLRSLLAGIRRASTSALSVLVVAFALVSVHVLCAVHLDDVAAGSSHAHDVVTTSTTFAESGPRDVAAGVSSLPVGEDPHGCTDHHSVDAQCDPLLPSPPVPAVLPEPAVQRLAPATAHDQHRVVTSVAAVAAPSLHALGISRT